MCIYVKLVIYRARHLNLNIVTKYSLRNLTSYKKKVPHQIYKALREKKVEKFSIILLQYFYV